MMQPDRMSHALIAIAATMIVIAVWGSTTTVGMREQHDEQRCQYRLHHLGKAVNHWVRDHNRRNFPPLINTESSNHWDPQLPGMPRTVLGRYLIGDGLPPQGDDQSDVDYQAQLLSLMPDLCPATNAPYRWNEGLAQVNPTDIAEGIAPVLYFRCPHHGDGTLPHEVSGVAGSYVCVGFGEQDVISAEEIDALAEIVQEHQKSDPSSTETQHLEEQLSIFRNAQISPEHAAKMIRLNVRIEFRSGT